MVPTILSVLLAVVGLIALRPQLTAVPGEAIARSDPFSVLFKVTNSGLLPVKSMRFFCFDYRVTYRHATFTDSITQDPMANTYELGRGQSRTIVCRLINADEIPSLADIAVVAEYKAYAVPFWTMRDIFRFVGNYGR
jgi:hypothetical protein